MSQVTSTLALQGVHCAQGTATICIWHIWPYLAYLGTYLGAHNMVEWGIPEKILQNAVQTRWS